MKPDFHAWPTAGLRFMRSRQGFREQGASSAAPTIIYHPPALHKTTIAVFKFLANSVGYSMRVEFDSTKTNAYIDFIIFDLLDLRH